MSLMPETVFASGEFVNCSVTLRHGDVALWVESCSLWVIRSVHFFFHVPESTGRAALLFQQACVLALQSQVYMI